MEDAQLVINAERTALRGGRLTDREKIAFARIRPEARVAMRDPERRDGWLAEIFVESIADAEFELSVLRLAGARAGSDLIESLGRNETNNEKLRPAIDYLRANPGAVEQSDASLARKIYGKKSGDKQLWRQYVQGEWTWGRTGERTARSLVSQAKRTLSR